MVSSFRGRLVFLVLGSILPAVGLLLHNAEEARRHAAAAAHETALGVVREVSSDYEQLIDGARQLLTGLPQVPAIRTIDAKVCAGVLADILRQFPLYTNLSAVSPDGDMVCSGVPSPAPANIADRAYFQQVLNQRGFAVGGYAKDPLTGRGNLTVSYPVLDAAGAVRALLFAGLDLSLTSQHVVEQLSEGSTVHGPLIKLSTPQDFRAVHIFAAAVSRD